MKAWTVSRKIRIKPAAFLDRDGTLTRNPSGVYITEPGRLKLYARAPRALRILAAKGYRLIVLTNQSGVARGYMRLERSRAINLKLKKLFDEKGARLDAVYFCPHKPGDGCSCRKPGEGLIRQAVKDFRTDLKASIVIGDKASDMRMAKNAGLKSFFVATGEGRAQLKKHAAALNGIPVLRDIFSAALRAPDRAQERMSQEHRQEVRRRRTRIRKRI